MALSVQDPVLIWQKVAKALAGANPATQAAFRDLKNYITTQGGNPQLQFIPYTAAQAIVNLGTSLVGGACTLYGWYGKTARTSGTTAAFENLHDAADNSATTTTMDTVRTRLTGQSFAIVHPTGQAFATDLVISSTTAVGGATESAAGDASYGFVIVGA
jgi:hypothetical protein